MRPLNWFMGWMWRGTLCEFVSSSRSVARVSAAELPYYQRALRSSESAIAHVQSLFQGPSAGKRGWQGGAAKT